MKTTPIAAALLLGIASGAYAESSSVTLYGNIDLYGNYMHSSSGTKTIAMEDGAYQRSRWGLRGNEDLGGGYGATFRLEGGFNSDNGSSATNGILFDRQSYVGLDTPWAEFRVGRQNGPIQARGNYIDFTARTLGSMINNFGVPSRYDNDVSFITKRYVGLQVEAHASLPESPVGNHPVVYQLGLDYVADSLRVGYLGLRGEPPTHATINKAVVYDNLYANWMYGKGTVYLAYVHSNNNTATALSKTAGAILGGSGGYNAGTNPDLNHFYDIWQGSVDYNVTSQLRIGALWGHIQDKSGRERGANGGAAGAYYDLSKRTMLLALVDTIRNDTNGGWRPSGSGGLKSNFTNPNDVNGRTITGLQLGVVHKF
ncbi:MAG: porin [Burkholderiaceae bacterium]